jgi:hypothetical protein
MLTWFQTSTQRGSVVGLPWGGVPGPPVQTKISESGPHRPTGPWDHQFSSLVSSTGRPNSRQVPSGSSSGPTSSSPPKTVAYIRSGGMPNPSRSSSCPQRRLCVWP